MTKREPEGEERRSLAVVRQLVKELEESRVKVLILPIPIAAATLIWGFPGFIVSSVTTVSMGYVIMKLTKK
jgi:hypothetical protein